MLRRDQGSAGASPHRFLNPSREFAISDCFRGPFKLNIVAMRRDLLIGFALAALVLCLYWPVRTHDFIFYDDPQFITENSQIQSGLTWATLAYAFTRPVAGNWHPLTTMSHALDCQLFGINAGAHHEVNALIHAANALLLFLLLQQLTRAKPLRPRTRGHPPGAVVGFDRTWLSALVATIFAFHPLRVESVAWVAERKDLLSGFFSLLSLCAYAFYVQGRGGYAEGKGKEGRAQTQRLRRRYRGYYVASLLCFAVGLMSKPMVVTLPFVMLLLDFWPLQRFTLSNIKTQIPRIGSLIIEKAPFLLLSILDCWITLAVQKSEGATEVIRQITWLERLDNAVTSYVRYLGKLFWPSDLAIVYPHPAKRYYLSDQWPAWEIAVAALLLIALTIFCLMQLRQRPYLAVGWFWFLGMLVPVIGLVQVGEQAMADRYSYLPLIGPVISLVWLASEGIGCRVSSGGQQIPPLLYGVVALLAVSVPLACLTRHQLNYWQDTITLFDHAISITADSPSAQFALGVGLERQGEIGKAMVRYRVATAIDRNYGKAYYNMGQVLRKAGKWQEAADAYLAAARSMPGDLATQLNLASVLPHLNRGKEAVAHFDEALRIDPASIEGLNNLAWLLSTSPDPRVRDGVRAVELAEQACSLTGSKIPVLLGTLAAAYAEAGRFSEAITAAQRAGAEATQLGDLAGAAKNQELLERYRANRPYRENAAEQ
jgi:tetratricopeptide (TPR) repeat protein